MVPFSGRRVLRTARGTAGGFAGAVVWLPLPWRDVVVVIAGFRFIIGLIRSGAGRMVPDVS
jgi:hypothetical protein